MTPLEYAICKGHQDIFELIFHDEKGEKNPPNKEGGTPLHLAADLGCKDICRMIIDEARDKNPKAKNGDTHCKIIQIRSQKYCGQVMSCAGC